MAKSVNGFLIPDTEVHLVSFLENAPMFKGGPTYQFHKFQAAFQHIKKFGHAVDVGAHVGTWTRVLGLTFDEVSMFEPVQEYYLLNEENTGHLDNIHRYNYALGDKEGSLNLSIDPESTGNTHAVNHTSGQHVRVLVRRLDDIKMPKIDFLKIDCEGFEYFVLRGGAKKILSDRPCIIVEQKPGMGSRQGLRDKEAVDLLMSWGAHVNWCMSGDYCLSW